MTDAGLARIAALVTHTPHFPIQGVLFHDGRAALPRAII
jgi:hypothetical protein